MSVHHELENTPPPCDGKRAGTVNPTIKEIVAQYLKANGYDGLYNQTGECGCELADLFACGVDSYGCHAGYKVPCNPDDCPNYGDCAWHIAAEKPQQGTRIEDLEPGEDWAVKHCDPHVEGCRCRACYPVTEPDTSERDFRRALVVALVPAYPINVVKLLDKADEIAVEYLLRENDRERGGK